MLKCLALIGILATGIGQAAQSERLLWGRWEGPFMVPGSAKIITITFTLRQDAANSTATISAQDETPVSAPVQATRHPNGRVTVSIQGIGQYEGMLLGDGRTLQGKLKLRGIELPLVLQLLVRSLPETKAVSEWMRKHAIPLKTVEPQGPLGDMMPLKKAVGSARIVAMGESTHGTREFFKLKHRMFEFLVEQMGFTVFALEAIQPEARSVNEYVQNGVGDPGAALRGLYVWPWKSTELLEMIEWMRAYNANPAHKRKVKFYGFDMQVPNRALSNVITYLMRVDPEYAVTAKELLSGVPHTEPERKIFGATAENQRVMAQIREVLAHMDALPRDSEGWAEARQDARIVQQAVQMMLAGPQGVAQRDEAMADNVNWILDQEGPKAKIMLWAHNDHVKTTLTEGKMFMGGHLRKQFGMELVTMGLLFNQGAFRASDNNKTLREFVVKPAPVGSLEAVLAAAGIPLFAVDLRTADRLPVIDWLKSPQSFRNIGSIYSEDQASRLQEQPPAEAFDIIICIEATSPTHGLPSPVLPDSVKPSSAPSSAPTQTEPQKPFWQIK